MGYIPTKEADFLPFAHNLYTYAKTNFARWQAPDPEPALNALLEDFEAKYEICRSPSHSSIDLHNKRDAHLALEHALRSWCRAWVLYNPNVTGEDRDSMGIRQPDHIHTAIPAPATQIEFFIRIIAPRILEIVFRDTNHSTYRIPYGYQGAIVYWAILDNPPSGGEELIHSVEATRSIFQMEPFAESDRGKTVYFALRWQNAKGQKGPWSDIQDAIIP